MTGHVLTLTEREGRILDELARDLTDIRARDWRSYRARADLMAVHIRDAARALEEA